MWALKTLFARKPRKNQLQVAGRAAAVIDHVIYDVGIDTLLRGTLLLEGSFRLRFVISAAPSGGAIIARVKVSELAEAQPFCAHGEAVALDSARLKLHTGRLVDAVLREFTAQSAAFRSLPPLER